MGNAITETSQGVPGIYDLPRCKERDSAVTLAPQFVA